MAEGRLGRGRRVAVIGGAGFIGSAISGAIAENGARADIFDIEVPAVSREGCIFRPFDLTQHASWPQDWRGYDAVVVAAGLLAKGCKENPREAWAVNVAGTIRLFDTIAASRPAPRVIFLSSAMVYSGACEDKPFRESDGVAASDLYTMAKLCGENALGFAAQAGLVSALVLRPFTVYGHGPLNGARGHLFGNWLALGRAGRPLVVHGDGTQTIDAVNVDVVAQACLAYLQKDSDVPYSVVNVTGGREVSLLRLASMFVESGLAPGYALEPAASSAPHRRYGNPAALEALLGRKLNQDPEDDIRGFLSEIARNNLRNSK